MRFTDKIFQLFACIVLALFIAACSEAQKPAGNEACGNETSRCEARHARSRCRGRALKCGR